MKKVLVLGAGMVAKPIIDFLLSKGIYTTVASNNPDRAQNLIKGSTKGKFVFWQADDIKTLDSLIEAHQITVSLLPYNFHVTIAERCLALKKHMVTTSYVKPDMQKLDTKAKEANILILNECGLDPGIDHMSAKRVIDTVHGFGGKINAFYSLCGALPTPQYANDNPFRYKFTWSPKGVLLAGNNEASYLKEGEKITINPNNLFKNPLKLKLKGIGEFEVYPNRNSLSYVDTYNIPETRTMFRGTIRYKGWCQIMDAFKTINLIDEKKNDYSNMTFAEMTAKLIGVSTKRNLIEKTAKKLDLSTNSATIMAMEFLGLFNDTPMNRGEDSTFEIISDLMVNKMMLTETEMDITILKHVFLAEYPDGKQEVISSKLIDYGKIGGDTSIARTVALPAACAVKMILDDEISARGVHIPVIPEIYIPILHELENMGIELHEEYGLPLSELPK